MKIHYRDTVKVKPISLSVWMDFENLRDPDVSEIYSMSPKQARKLARRLTQAAAKIDGGKS